MSQSLTIELNEQTYRAIERRAEEQGDSPSRIAANVLEKQFQANGSTTGGDVRDDECQNSIRQFFGAVNVPDPFGADNEQIDADLVREYYDSHDPD
jgi:hypothetical protein